MEFWNTFIELLKLWTVPLALLGCIPYIIWMVRLFRRRRNFIYLALQIVLPLLWVGMLYYSGEYVSRELVAAHNNQYLLQRLEIEADWGRPVQEYILVAPAAGDHHVIRVFHIPDAVWEKFITPDTAWLKIHPSWNNNGAGWQSTHWQHLPLSEKHKQHCKFVLPEYLPLAKASLLSACAEITGIVMQGKAYYAMEYEATDSSDGAGLRFFGMDMLIVDMAHRLLYVITKRV